MRFIFTISDDNKKFLEQAKAKMNIKTTSELLNKIIFDYAMIHNKTSPFDITKLDEKKWHKLYEYRVKLTYDENEFVKSQAQKHGGISITKELRLRLVNTFYDEDFVPRIDMLNLLLRTEANINAFRKIKEHIEAIEIFVLDEKCEALLDENLKKLTQICQHLSELSNRQFLMVEQ